MNPHDKTARLYHGFEQGPIRPPSEARSLLIRVTRNCPWNRCTFCPVYKSATFSIRPVEHVKRDIDAVYRNIETLQRLADETGRVRRCDIHQAFPNADPAESHALRAAIHWFRAGRLKSIFLQDANTLIVKPPDLIDILNHLTSRFPQAERITSYARAHTVALRKGADLKAIRDAGLNRIHIGLESGSDRVLEMTRKGATKDKHIKAGRKVKNAGIELSEYYMPGLAGSELSEVHAVESAHALNQINPDFIRLRTLAIAPHTPLFEEYDAGRFQKCTDLQVVKELLLFIENLDGITSTIKSDHILNLFEDLQGTLPRDKESMLDILRTFLAMDPESQTLYQAGRRLGIFVRLADMDDPAKVAHAETARRQLGITPENADRIIREITRRYV